MDYDLWAEKKALDATKTGVKGLVDAGIKEIPRMFIRPPHELAEDLNMCKSTEEVPVVDLSGVEVEERRKKIVDEVRVACEKWGLLQVINHGVPSSVLKGVIDGVRKFHEQDVEVKKKWYNSDPRTRVRLESNFLRSKTDGVLANWKDTLHISGVVCDNVEPEIIPQVCRNSSVDYINHVAKLAEILLGLLSEALGLKTDYLKECAATLNLICHYAPACPQPWLTLGSCAHTDPTFLSVVLQDHSGGFQAMCNNQWADVEPMEDALIVHIGDFLEMLSNGQFISANHRVLAKEVGPRISVVTFFRGPPQPKRFGPIKELISEEKPQVYKDFTVAEFVNAYLTRPVDKTALDLFKLQ